MLSGSSCGGRLLTVTTGLLLISFLVIFFGIEQYAASVGASDVKIKYIGVSLLKPEIRAFLGGGIVLLEVAVILLSMVERMLTILRDTVKPLIRLLPLGAFLISIYKTLFPIAQNLIVGGGDTAFIAQAVESGSLNNDILLTIGTMLLFLIVTPLLSTSDRQEVERLRAKLAQGQKILK